MSDQKHRRIIYLACPYTDAVAEIREERFQAATKAAGFLIERDHIVFSPITITSPIDITLSGKMGTLGSDFWVRFDEAFMNVCSEMAILTLPGWDKSGGIARERRFFEDQGRPVWFLDPQLPDYGLSLVSLRRQRAKRSA